MKIIKIIDLILLLFVSAVGIVHEIVPTLIPDWLFNAMWIVGAIALVIFGIILHIEKKWK